MRLNPVERSAGLKLKNCLIIVIFQNKKMDISFKFSVPTTDLTPEGKLLLTKMKIKLPYVSGKDRHEELVGYARSSNHGRFLEISSRLKYQSNMPQSCELCGFGQYSCFGGACMGMGVGVATIDDTFSNPVSVGRKIPGLQKLDEFNSLGEKKPVNMGKVKKVKASKKKVKVKIEKKNKDKNEEAKHKKKKEKKKEKIEEKSRGAAITRKSSWEQRKIIKSILMRKRSKPRPKMSVKRVSENFKYKVPVCVSETPCNRLQKKQKERREKGPGRYYVLEPIKPKKIEALEIIIGNFLSSRCCVVCEEATGEQVLKCKGPCGTHYHPACLQMDSGMGTEDGFFKCTQCQLNRHKCFLCKKYGDEGKVKVEAGNEGVPVGTPDLGHTRKCAMSGCGKWYHEVCLTNIRDPVMKYNEKLMHCVRCPTAYHCGDYCVAAGTIQITKTDIICPKHCKPPAKNKKGSTNVHVNTSCCFVCSKGGSLICCEICPSSFHTECLNITSPPEGKYYCDDCVSGRMPLYNDLAWIKLGAYRWWPARVLHPSNVPDNIEKLKHQDGEFPIQFLGSGDYYWINHGSAFLYEEGDSESSLTVIIKDYGCFI